MRESTATNFWTVRDSLHDRLLLFSGHLPGRRQRDLPAVRLPRSGNPLPVWYRRVRSDAPAVVRVSMMPSTTTTENGRGSLPQAHLPSSMCMYAIAWGPLLPVPLVVGPVLPSMYLTIVIVVRSTMYAWSRRPKKLKDGVPEDVGGSPTTVTKKA